MKVYAIVVAAGDSTRMQGIDKVFADVAGMPLVRRTLIPLLASPRIDSIIIVTKKTNFPRIRAMLGAGWNKVSFSEGGAKRQDSVFKGFSSIKEARDDDIVLVHNVSNPTVADDELSRVIDAASSSGAALLAFPVKDTIKMAEEGAVKKTISRDSLWQAQTPQALRYGIMKKGFAKLRKEGLSVTDDVSLAELVGVRARLVRCSYANTKVTTPEDVGIASALMARPSTQEMRIGMGEDGHRFLHTKSKPLVLGGHTIKGERGLEANSDGDVILHALFNAISSALGSRSLSITADPMCAKGIQESSAYVKVVLRALKDAGFVIHNISISVEARTPRLEPHHGNIKKNLMKLLDLEESDIGITFTTGNGLIASGRGDGMRCTCAVLLRKG